VGNWEGKRENHGPGFRNLLDTPKQRPKELEKGTRCTFLNLKCRRTLGKDTGNINLGEDKDLYSNRGGGVKENITVITMVTSTYALIMRKLEMES